MAWIFGRVALCVVYTASIVGAKCKGTHAILHGHKAGEDPEWPCTFILAKT